MSTFADIKNNDAVSMENFEQRWLDSESTIALKNNTDEIIYNVTYRITYLDMQGKALDYKDFSSEVEIEPGMVKKVDIPAYEHDRFYQYYKNSEGKYDDHPKFKVEFELKGYNLDEKEIEIEDSTFSSGNSMLLTLLIIGLSIFILGIAIGSYILVAVMANHRHRSAALWVIISLFTTPILVIIILLCIGESDEIR